MNFISPIFVLFFLACLLGFIVLPATKRKYYLLGMSYLFYGSWSIPFIGIILLTTSIDYWMSHIIANTQKPIVKKMSLWFGLTLNLGVLIYFKYTNFLLSNSQSLFSYFHLHVPFPNSLSIILPLGISFFTFEAMSYLIDVYRGSPPSKSWLEYNFYIMYFPHLISGPIIRFKELQQQYATKIELPSLNALTKGTELILLGFLFKVFIADSVAEWADSVFLAPSKVSVMATYIGVLAFTVQIYFDFLGYTHIARGVSLFFNIELPLNFNHPYLAQNISDFWKRWHISLSRWIRDYLYFPLGGSHCTLKRTVLNLVLTMTLCGAWHGAGWLYILWGLYHGLLLGSYHLFQQLSSRPSVIRSFPWFQHFKTYQTTGAYRALSVLITFMAVAGGWILFRAPSVSVAFQVFQNLWNFPQLKVESSLQLVQILFLAMCCFSGPWVIRGLANLYKPLPFWLKAQTACFILILSFVWGAGVFKPFIYFQF